MAIWPVRSGLYLELNDFHDWALCCVVSNCPQQNCHESSTKSFCYHQRRKQYFSTMNSVPCEQHLEGEYRLHSCLVLQTSAGDEQCCKKLQ